MQIAQYSSQPGGPLKGAGGCIYIWFIRSHFGSSRESAPACNCLRANWGYPIQIQFYPPPFFLRRFYSSVGPSRIGHCNSRRISQDIPWENGGNAERVKLSTLWVGKIVDGAVLPSSTSKPRLLRILYIPKIAYLRKVLEKALGLLVRALMDPIGINGLLSHSPISRRETRVQQVAKVVGIPGHRVWDLIRPPVQQQLERRTSGNEGNSSTVKAQ